MGAPDRLLQQARIERDQVLDRLDFALEPFRHVGGLVEIVSEVVRIPELADLFWGNP